MPTAGRSILFTGRRANWRSPGRASAAPTLRLGVGAARGCSSGEERTSYAGGAAARVTATVWVPPYGLTKVTFTRSPGRSLWIRVASSLIVGVA
jgi:hypothetical protein